MLAALLQPPTPIVVKVVGETPQDIGVIDIIYGSLGITGVILAGSLLLGLFLGILIIWVRKRMEAREPDHAPSSAYGFTPSTVGRASEPGHKE